MLKRTLAVGAVVLLALHAALAQQPQAPAAAGGSAEDLKKLMQEMLTAAKAADATKVQTMANALVLPSHEAWFKQVFGDEKGAALAADYGPHTAEFAEQLGGFFAKLVEQGRTEVHTVLIDKSDSADATGLQSTAIAAMKQPMALYTAEFVVPGDKDGTTLWSFVYVDGAFRFVGKLRPLSP
jgi:hypothetical protein